MSGVTSDQEDTLDQESARADDRTDRRMKGETRYQDRPESPSSDSDEYIQQSHEYTQQPKIRNQSNTKQSFGRRQQAPYGSSRYERYEGEPPTLQDRETRGRAVLVKFFKDDDRLHRGITVSINDRQFKSIESLCEYLNTKITTKHGVRHIFNPKTKKEVKSIKELERGDVCTVSSNARFKNDVIMHNILMEQSTSPTKSLVTNSQRASRDQGRYDRSQLSDGSSTRTPNSTAPAKKVTFTIVSNSDRYSKEKMILNPNTSQPFEQLVEDMGTMLQLKYPPATGIFSSRKPYQQIFSFSQLNREVKVNDCFFVCGKERYPEELGVTDTNEDSLSEQEPEPVQKNQKNKKGPPAKKISPLKRRNDPSTEINQKENMSPPERSKQVVKEVKKGNKTPRFEAEPRRQPNKGNKTSRKAEEQDHPNDSKYGTNESKKTVRTSRQQDPPSPPRKTNKASPRYEDDHSEHRKPNKNGHQQQNQPEYGKHNGHARFEEEDNEDDYEQSRGIDHGDEMGRKQNGRMHSDEGEEDEDDDDYQVDYPQTSRTRKPERMETPEY
ncbi:protein rpi-1-like [Argopecten irradians]|uniref:protein rpi-1-like n=1 Tax=Argopecten irradians TaxID=31199 RepID=UPI0037208C18